MQITVSNFLKLPTQQLNQLKNLQFFDDEEELDEDFSLLTDSDFFELCKLLINCNQLYILELCDNNIGNLYLSRIEMLTNSISNCGKLKILDLSNNNLQNFDLETWNVLLDGLAKSFTLDTLIINNNKLGTLKPELLNTIFDNLIPKQLSRLELASNKIGNNIALDIFIKKIVNYPKLITLNLSSNRLFNNPEQVLNLFANLNSIKKLNLSYNDLGYIETNLISEMMVSNNLELLDLSNNQLGQSSEFFVFMMNQSNTVKELDLSYNKIYLLSDNLTFNKHKKLESLTLPNNDFVMLEQQDFIKLITSLRQCNTLKDLDLANINLINLPTADLNLLFDMLIDNENLTILNLATNKLGSTNIIPELGHLLKQNKLTKLDISDNLLSCLSKENWQSMFTGLACSYNLMKLNISSNQLEAEPAMLISLIQVLQNCLSLQKLDLCDNNFTSIPSCELQELFNGLAKLPKLSKLDLRYSLTDGLQVVDNTVLFDFIQNNTNLTTLTLERDIPCKFEQKIQQTLTNKPSLRLKLK